MQQIFAAAAQMQSQLMSAQQQLAETEVEGTAGGGLVTVTLNGQGEVVDLRISKQAIDQGDAEETAQTISDLVLAACRDAYTALGEVQAEMMSPLAGGLGGLGDLGGGAGLPGLPGFPGLPGSSSHLDDEEDEDDEDDEEEDDEEEDDEEDEEDER